MANEKFHLNKLKINREKKIKKYREYLRMLLLRVAC